jgi:hypothetical protein
MPRPVVLEIRKVKAGYWLRTRSRGARGALRTEGQLIVPHEDVRVVLTRPDALLALKLPPRVIREIQPSPADLPGIEVI